MRVVQSPDQEVLSTLARRMVQELTQPSDPGRMRRPDLWLIFIGREV